MYFLLILLNIPGIVTITIQKYFTNLSQQQLCNLDWKSSRIVDGRGL